MTMKISKIIPKITAFLLVLAIFLANTGFVLSSHSCKMRGEKTSFHLFSPKKITEDKCCSKKTLEKSTQSDKKDKKDACCSFSDKHVKTDIQQDVPNFGIDFTFISPVILASFSPKNLVGRTFYVKIKTFFTFYNKPPPISNRILLHLYSILRI